MGHLTRTGRARHGGPRALGPILFLFLFVLGACDGEFLPECDDPFPALIVRSVDGAGVRIQPDKVEAFHGDQLVDTLQCGLGECATWNLQTGTYRIVGSWQGQTREQTVTVENSHACSHDVAEVEFAFDGVGMR